MRFFSIDQHISVIADLKNIFGKLGHTIDDICLSGHATIMGRKIDSIPMLDGNNWCGFVQQRKWDEFFQAYPDLDEKYDGFICCYPPILSYLYKRFKKPIIIDIPIRYEYPCQSSAEDWNNFNQYLQEGVDSKRIYLVANSIYEKEYTKLFLDREVRYIPSLCLYTGMKYDPKRNEFIYRAAKSFSELNNTNFKLKNQVLAFGHPWQAVAEYSGVVHFPYNVSTMSTFEEYSANIPLFVPSLDFTMKLYSKGLAYRMLEQISWAGTFGRESGSVIPVKPRMPDPNDFKNMEAVRYWMQFADYYNETAMPHIVHFDSFDDLHDKAMHLDLDAISEKMKSTNFIRQKETIDKWQTLLETVKNDHRL